jgi:3-dehydroquinate synthetase
MCGDKIKDETEYVLGNIGLPVEYEFDREKVREIIAHDKKSGADKITVVKCDEIGSFYFEELTADEIINLI